MSKNNLNEKNMNDHKKNNIINKKNKKNKTKTNSKEEEEREDYDE